MATGILTRIELDIAYSSEKVLNLDMLLMQVASRVSDHDTSQLDDELMFTEFAQKEFEFDVLCGILSSEVTEIDSFMTQLEEEIAATHEKLIGLLNLDMSVEEIKEKLRDAEESLKQSQYHVFEIKAQLAKFERILTLDKRKMGKAGEEELSDSSQNGSSDVDWRTLTVEQQRRTLQMLEKSLARELDLERKLSELNNNEDEFRLKLHYAERETYFIEEAIESISEKLFEAENAAVVLMAISKELTGKLQVVQLNLNSSVSCGSSLQCENNLSNQNEVDVRNLDDLKLILKEAEDKSVAANLEALALRDTINLLENQLAESNLQLQEAKTSMVAIIERQKELNTELANKENKIVDLKENIFQAESRAKDAEDKCVMLTETNLVLNKELGFLKGDGAEKADFLERKLEESDAQIEHAKASVEAIEEQQSMLYSAFGEMQHLIGELKAQVSKAEKRAGNAEAKCSLLTETNLELNEELGYLRARLEGLERSLYKSKHEKSTTAKDIGVRTRIISDLVMQLSLGREHLQMQISALRKENKMLSERFRKSNPKKATEESLQESEMESYPENLKVQKSAGKSIHEADENPMVPSKEETTNSNPMPPRNLEAWKFNLKYIILAFLILLIPVFSAYLLQMKNSVSQ